MEQLSRDLSFAFRQLLRHKGFTSVAVLTLAFGIGANAAIFTLAHAILLKSLPVADPKQLYRLGDRDAGDMRSKASQPGGGLQRGHHGERRHGHDHPRGQADSEGDLREHGDGQRDLAA